MLNSKNSRKQGDIGLGNAIAYFASRGWTVCIPLTDNQHYDLIVDDGNKLNRIQVKTSKCINENKTYDVELRTMGGNRSGIGKTTLFDPKKLEYVFVLTNNGNRYLIPAKKIKATCGITVGKKWNEYKIV